MIQVEVNKNDLAYIQGKLKGMEGETPKVLKNAVNRTAREARRRLAETAQRKYTVKNAGFNSRARIKNATLSNPTAEIRVKGKTLTLPRFHVTKPASGVRAEVIQGGGLKVLVGSRKIKAFAAKVASGKTTTNQILQRKGKSRYPLKTLRGSSVPKMLEKVYGGRTESGLKKEIEKMYRSNVEAEIGKVLGKR